MVPPVCLDDRAICGSGGREVLPRMVMPVGHGFPVALCRFFVRVAMRKATLGVGMGQAAVRVINRKIDQSLQGSEREQPHAKQCQRGGKVPLMLA